MKKRIIPVVLLLVMAISFCTAAYASTNAATVKPTLSFSGTTAYCKVSITEAGKEIDVTLELWCGNTFIDSWSATAMNYVRISESHTVSSGKTYTLKVTGTVGEETISSTPVSGTCP